MCSMIKDHRSSFQVNSWIDLLILKIFNGCLVRNLTECWGFKSKHTSDAEMLIKIILKDSMCGKYSVQLNWQRNRQDNVVGSTGPDLEFEEKRFL